MIEELEIYGQQEIDHFFNKVENMIDVYSLLTDNEWRVIRESVYVSRRNKNTTFHSIGDKERYARYILKGVVKIIVDSSESYVYDFRSGGDYLCDILSLVKRRNSRFSFETVTDCYWLEADASSLIKFNSKIANIFSMMLVEHIKNNYNRYLFLRSLNAGERYLEFCRLYPEVIKYAKLSDIASFLEVTTQSLSRIRKKSIFY